jgi:hypothetical protein
MQAFENEYFPALADDMDYMASSPRLPTTTSTLAAAAVEFAPFHPLALPRQRDRPDPGGG